MKKSSITLLTTALFASAPAFADGLSGTLDLNSTSGIFSARGSLNYSLEVSPNLFVGASVSPIYTPSLPTDQFGLQTRVAAKYVALITKNFDYSVNAYVGTGVNLQVLPVPVTVAADLNAGVDGYNQIASGIKVYGGIDGKLIFAFAGGGLGYDLAGFGGFFFEPIANLEARVQGAVGLGGAFSGGNAVRWEAVSSLYYAFAPQFKLGANIGYGSNGFRIGLGVLFTEKPGSLGIAGNYLP